MKVSKQDYDDAMKQLRKRLRPGATVYCVLRHVSKSGMSRRIDFYVMRQNKPVYLTGYMGNVLGCRRSNDDGSLVVSGGGDVDMGFDMVNNLSRVLFPKGFVPAKAGKCGRNGEDANAVDQDGGYALNHRWL